MAKGLRLLTGSHPFPRCTMDSQADSILSRIDRFVSGVLVVTTGVAFALMVLAVFAAVILREIVEIGWPWLEEIARYLLIWSVFLSAAILARRNEHITIDVIFNWLPPSLKMLVRVAIALLGIFIAGYFAYLGWHFTARAYQQGQMSLTGYLPVWIGYLVIPLGLGLGALSYLLWLLESLRGRRRNPLS